MMTERLRLASYNSTGFGHDKKKFINDIAQVSDIVFLQEHWLHKKNLNELDSLHIDFVSHGCSGMPSKDLLKRGRPYGGSGFLYRLSLDHLVTKLDTKITNICALQVGQCLMINVYLPGDNYHATEITDQFRSTVNGLENFINSRANDSYSSVIIAGDFNIDLGRENAHSKYVAELAVRHKLLFVDSHAKSNYDCTFIRRRDNGTVVKSSVDHFLVSEDVFDEIDLVRCEDSIDNPPGHLAYFVNTVINNVNHILPIETSATEPLYSKVAWHKLTDGHRDNYKRIVENKLKFIPLPEAVFCNDPKCKCDNHKQGIDKLCDLLVNSCLNAGEQCLPKVKKQNGKPKCTPYWNEEVGMKREEALEAQWLWEATGRPTSGRLYDDMRRTRRRYHYAVRMIKSNEVALRNKKMAECLANRCESDMWKEVKKSGSIKKPSNIDKICDDPSIVQLFADKNRDLYNSVPSDADVMSELVGKVESGIGHEQFTNHKFDVKSVRKSIVNIQSGKSDGDVGLTSDHVKLAPPVFSVYLTLLFNAMLCHGYVPEQMLKGTITHIPKDPSGKLSDSTNYRGICLCICLTKIFEDVFIALYGEKLDTCGLQFAYKKKLSTNTATLTLKELLNYYKLRSTTVYGCSLDASKAFDRIRHDKLYDVLLHRGIPPIILRLIMDLYSRQSSRCRYFSSVSEFYSVCNGVRQGGVASPILFIVYMDVLYSRLIKAGIGLHIGSMFYGIVGYADDMLLLAASLGGLQKMLKLCEDFGHEFDLKYNPTKSKLIVFNPDKGPIDICDVFLNGLPIPRVTWLEYLGNIIRDNLSDCDDVKCKVEDLNARTNSLVHTFGCADRLVKCKLFASKCAHAYGSETWDMTNSVCNMYWKASAQALRRILGLPPSCPSIIVETVANGVNGRFVVYKKVVGIVTSFEKSDNPYVKFVYENAVRDARSIISRNMSAITREWGGSMQKPQFVPCHTPECLGVMEMLDIRENKSTLADCDMSDVDYWVLMFSER